MIHGAHRSAAELCTLEPGTHLCALERGDRRLDRVAATFVGHGLAAGDQLLYVASDDQADALVTALPGHVRAASAVASGQLRFLSFEAAYGAGRPDDLDAMAAGFRDAAAQSRKEGFPHLRVAARMDSLAAWLGSDAEVVAWERMSTRLQREIQVSSVCLYDARLLDPGQTALIAREHVGQAPAVDAPPPAAFLAVDEPWGLRVSGAVDASNRDLLQRAVLARAAVDPRVRLDLGDAASVDVGALEQLHDVAARLPEDGWLALDRVPAGIRRLLDVPGLRHERLTISS